MDRDPESPWNPAVPIQMTPTEFETVVLDWLRSAAKAEKQTIDAQHLAVVKGAGGDYKIDVCVTFHQFSGAKFVVLVECKHQRRPIEREDVLILHAKVRDAGAHKGLLFSTSGFQSGALEYAKTHGLATVAVVDGSWVYQTKAAGGGPMKPPPWANIDAIVGVRMRKIPTGVSCHTIQIDLPDAIVEWLRDQPNGCAGNIP